MKCVQRLHEDFERCVFLKPPRSFRCHVTSSCGAVRILNSIAQCLDVVHFLALWSPNKLDQCVMVHLSAATCTSNSFMNCVCLFNRWSVSWEQRIEKKRKLVLLFRFFVVEDKSKTECNNKKNDLSMKFSRYRFKQFFIVSLHCARTFCAAALGGEGNFCWWNHDLTRNTEFLRCSFQDLLPTLYLQGLSFIPCVQSWNE